MKAHRRVEIKCRTVPVTVLHENLSNEIIVFKTLQNGAQMLWIS